jgi:hypothetical protein
MEEAKRRGSKARIAPAIDGSPPRLEPAPAGLRSLTGWRYPLYPVWRAAPGTQRTSKRQV